MVNNIRMNKVALLCCANPFFFKHKIYTYMYIECKLMSDMNNVDIYC